LSFASVAFLFYFLPATTAVFFALGFSRRAQDRWLLLAGLAFCALGDPAVALGLLVCVLACTALGLLAERARKRGGLPWTAALACAFPLALFFLVRCLPILLPALPWAPDVAGGANADAPGGANATAAGAVLPFMRPIGLAFFTLQALSYLLDVARGEAPAERSPVAVGLSVAFFPRLLAGPILRHAEIAPRLRTRRVTWDDFSEGICRFIAGLGKTALIAYPMRQVADYVFRMAALHEGADGGAGLSVTLAWAGLAAYALQLYCGFSGCSDMAVGLSRMFGFAAKENFDSPYTARSLTDFWRRWHISLSDWFRAYLWAPPDESTDADGGRAARRSFVVWLCIGLWHGAAPTLIIWALWQFFWLTVERITRLDRREIPGTLRRLYLSVVVGIGLIFFRAPDTANAFAYLRAALGLSRNAFTDGSLLMLLREYWPVFLAGILICAAPRVRLPRAFLPGFAAAALRALALATVFFTALLCVVRAGGVIWV
jgi:alginate O-acetyltransferase complex protein AlgI